MPRFTDFDLDIQVSSKTSDSETLVTSISLCTPGCPTGVLQTCLSNGCVQG